MSPIGDIVCSSCWKTWPCHFQEWTMGGTVCPGCQHDSLFWRGPVDD